MGGRGAYLSHYIVSFPQRIFVDYIFDKILGQTSQVVLKEKLRVVGHWWW